MYYGGMRKYSDVIRTRKGREAGLGGWEGAKLGKLGTNSCWFPARARRAPLMRSARVPLVSSA